MGLETKETWIESVHSRWKELRKHIAWGIISTITAIKNLGKTPFFLDLPKEKKNKWLELFQRCRIEEDLVLGQHTIFETDVWIYETRLTGRGFKILRRWDHEGKNVQLYRKENFQFIDLEHDNQLVIADCNRDWMIKGRPFQLDQTSPILGMKIGLKWKGDDGKTERKKIHWVNHVGLTIKEAYPADEELVGWILFLLKQQKKNETPNSRFRIARISHRRTKRNAEFSSCKKT